MGHRKARDRMSAPAESELLVSAPRPGTGQPSPAEISAGAVRPGKLIRPGSSEGGPADGSGMSGLVSTLAAACRTVGPGNPSFTSVSETAPNVADTHRRWIGSRQRGSAGACHSELHRGAAMLAGYIRLHRTDNSEAREMRA
jgi:hypothetical protein